VRVAVLASWLFIWLIFFSSLLSPFVSIVAVTITGQVVNRVIVAGAIQYQIYEDQVPVRWWRRGIMRSRGIRPLGCDTALPRRRLLGLRPRSVPAQLPAAPCPFRDRHLAPLSLVCAWLQHFIASGNANYFECNNKGCDTSKPIALALADPTSAYSTYTATLVFPVPTPTLTGRYNAVVWGVDQVLLAPPLLLREQCAWVVFVPMPRLSPSLNVCFTVSFRAEPLAVRLHRPGGLHTELRGRL
jgi:hypothetical protein